MDINLGKLQADVPWNEFDFKPGFKYSSRNPTSPAELYGGTWELQDYHDFQGLYIWIKTAD